MTEKGPSSLVLYREVGKRRCTCEHGQGHDVPLYASITVSDSGKTWVADNGYEKRTEAVYVDTDGDEYRRMVTIDYSNNVYYLAPDNRAWWPRPPYGGEPDKGSSHDPSIKGEQK